MNDSNDAPVTRPDLDLLAAQLENIARRGDSYSEDGGFLIDDEDAATCREAIAALAAERARADQAEQERNEAHKTIRALVAVKPADHKFRPVVMNPNPLGREYTVAEIAASKRLGISELGPHASPGPLYFAGGAYLPDKWRQIASDRALVSNALDREWAKPVPTAEQ